MQLQDKSKDGSEKKERKSLGEKTRQEKLGMKQLFTQQFGYTPTPSTLSKHKLEHVRGCDWLTEISITVRRCRKTTLPRDRLEYFFHSACQNSQCCNDLPHEIAWRSTVFLAVDLKYKNV